MTFEIKGLVDYRLDRVDTIAILLAKEPRNSTLAEHPPADTRTRLRTRRLLPADVLPMVWWIHGGASLAFRAGGQPEKQLLLAHHRSLDCLHVPAKQLPSRAPPVLPSRSHRNGNTSVTQGVRRWAARGQGPSSQVACARRQAQVEYV